MANKILILSDEDDYSTEIVLRWIEYFGNEYLRLNGNDELNFLSLCIDNESENNEVLFTYNGKTYNLNEFSSYWYRRGRLNFKYKFYKFENKKFEQSVNNSLENEYTYLNNFIYNFFEKRNRKSIGSIFENQTNKLTNLLEALEIGLKVPKSKVITQKKELIEFMGNDEYVLTKPIYQRGFEYKDDFVTTNGLSTLIMKDSISAFEDTFSPTLVQKYIDKLYELRIFYLEGKCYSSAIFSQLDTQTKIDFRNYNWNKPNRTPPYKLPNDIENKIVTFMHKIKMNSGSIDMIVTPKMDFVFLEVNPVGQFFQVTTPCNYYLEKIIAEYLCGKK